MWGVRTAGLAMALGIGAAGTAAAQQGDPKATIAAQAQAMAPLAWMDGRWRGPGWALIPVGRHEIVQTERVGPLLDGSIKVMEGKSFEPDGKPAAFNAFGVLSYDAASKAYTLHSYAQGRAGDFPLTPTADGYVWTIPMGPVSMRYTATHADDAWTEVGDLLRPGAPDTRVFEMRLKRVGDTDWPLAGQATAAH